MRSERYKRWATSSPEVERRRQASESGRMVNWKRASSPRVGHTSKRRNSAIGAPRRTSGRSTKVRGAGMFVTMLSRKARAVGGEVELQDAHNRVVQFDHMSGEYIKKRAAVPGGVSEVQNLREG